MEGVEEDHAGSGSEGGGREVTVWDAGLLINAGQGLKLFRQIGGQGGERRC